MENKDTFNNNKDFSILNIFKSTYDKCIKQSLSPFFSGLTMAVNIGFFALIGITGMSVLINNIISWLLTLTFVYFINHIWILRSQSDNVIKDSFCLGRRVIILVIEEITLFIGVILLGLNSLLIKIVAMCFIILGNYFISRIQVFHKSDNIYLGKLSFRHSINHFVENTKDKKGCLFIWYTLLFLIVIFVMYSYFKYNNCSLIYKGDSYKTYLKSFIYTCKWYKEMIRNHSFFTYSQFLGLGNDIISTLYYIIGDPLTLLGIFVITENLTQFYQILIFVRLYLSGVTFSLYCLNKKQYSNYAILLGSLIYVFAIYNIYASFTIPFMINIGIYFPLFLLGIDCLFKGKNICLLIVGTFLGVLSNVYYAPLFLLAGIIYFICQLIIFKKDINVFKFLFKFMFSIIISLMMSGILIIPVYMMSIEEISISPSYIVNLLTNVDFYQSFISNFIIFNSTYEHSLGFGLLTFTAILLLFSRDHHNLCKMTLIFFIGLLIISEIYEIYSLFSLVWAINMLIGYIYVISFDYFLNLYRRQLIFIILVLSLFGCLCFAIDYIDMEKIAFELMIVISLLFVLYILKNKDIKSIGTFILIMGIILSISLSNFYLLSLQEYNLISNFYDNGELEDIISYNDSEAISSLSENDVIRMGSYMNDEIIESDTGLLYGLSSTSYSYNLNNGYVNEFLEDMSITSYLEGDYNNLDERSYLNALFNVNYYAVDNTIENSSKYKPYGYEYLASTSYAYDDEEYEDLNDEEKMEKLMESLGIEDEESFIDLDALLSKLISQQEEVQYDVYTNKYTLPLGYTYSTYINENEYEEMSSIQKQEALLQGILVEGIDTNDYKETKVDYSEENLDYTVSFKSLDISMVENSFVVTSEKQSITLEFNGLGNSETYIYFEGFSYQGVNEVELYTDDEDSDPYNLYTPEMWEIMTTYEKNVLLDEYEEWEEEKDQTFTFSTYTGGEVQTTKSVTISASTDDFYNDGVNLLINMCYSKNARTKIKITFPEIGIYSFDNLKIICQPMDNYKEYINDLSADTLENVTYSGNTIKGEIDLDDDKILCLSIPYSEGWDCYVDGEEVDVLRANTMFMAVELKEGYHDIEFRYSTPGLNMGFLVSASGLLLFLLTCLMINIKRVLIYFKNRR